MYEDVRMGVIGVFVSFHMDDEDQKNSLVESFSEEENRFGEKGIKIISTSVNYSDIHPELSHEETMRVIKSNHLRYTDVTLVIVGRNTWRRKYIDWEVAASLKPRRLGGLKRKGLIAVGHQDYILPKRLQENIDCGYAIKTIWPSPEDILDALERSRTVRPITKRPLAKTDNERPEPPPIDYEYHPDGWDYDEMDRHYEAREKKLKLSSKKRKNKYGSGRTNLL